MRFHEIWGCLCRRADLTGRRVLVNIVAGRAGDAAGNKREIVRL